MRSKPSQRKKGARNIFLWMIILLVALYGFIPNIGVGMVFADMVTEEAVDEGSDDQPVNSTDEPSETEEISVGEDGEQETPTATDEGTEEALDGDNEAKNNDEASDDLVDHEPVDEHPVENDEEQEEQEEQGEQEEQKEEVVEDPELVDEVPVPLGGAQMLDLEPVRVELHSAHRNALSTEFKNESDCGGLTDPVVWHFVANQLQGDEGPLTLEVTFQNGGTKMVTGQPVGNGKVQHFFVGTPDHDVLLDAFLMVPAGSNGAKLVLSHVCLENYLEPDCIMVPLDAVIHLESIQFNQPYSNQYFTVTWLSANQVEITVNEGYCIGFHLTSYQYPPGTDVQPNGEPYEVQNWFDDDHHLFEGPETMILQVETPRDCEPVQIDLYTYRWLEGEWQPGLVEVPPHHGEAFESTQRLHSAVVVLPDEPCEEDPPTVIVEKRVVDENGTVIETDEQEFEFEVRLAAMELVTLLEEEEETTEEETGLPTIFENLSQVNAVILEGLSFGAYMLEEINLPAGYQLVGYQMGEETWLVGEAAGVDEGILFFINPGMEDMTIIIINRLVPEEPGDDPEEPGDDPEEPGDDPEEPGDDPEDPADDPEEPVVVLTETVTLEDPVIPLAAPVVPQSDPDEVIVLDQTIPLGLPVLPQTGEGNPVLYQMAGLLLAAAGFLFRKKEEM